MSKNPKIEFYKIQLNSIEPEQFITFREIYTRVRENHINEQDLEINLNQIPNDNTLMLDFYRHFFQTSAGTVINENKNKAFSVKPDTAEVLDKVKIDIDRNIIHGIMKGGEFRTGKSIGEIDDPNKAPERLADMNVITDDFYFLIYTPLDSDTGILLLQSYTKDNINDIFRPFVENLFKVKKLSLKAVTKIFMPISMQEEFKSNSIIKSFRYSNRVVVNGIEDQHVLEGEFTINVEIKAHDKNVNLQNLPIWRQRLGRAILGLPDESQRHLDTFSKKNGYIDSNDGKTTPTKFNLDAAEMEINPTIFLINEINLEENGVPIWQELEDFAYSTLESIIKPEVYPENYLNGDN